MESGCEEGNGGQVKGHRQIVEESGFSAAQSISGEGCIGFVEGNERILCWRRPWLHVTGTVIIWPGRDGNK